ncbi:MAG: undecaprenyl-diphosphate phosphatase [Clostridia bacterium]|nr:undecaprenyl-diphosphate phosphatase [Clostridia bacterium]
MIFFDFLKALFLGIVQGITEWLPVSSTGHMILFDKFTNMNVSPEFMEMFRVVIQFGSILAVLILYRKRLFPWTKDNTPDETRRTLTLWGNIIIAAIPAAVIGLLFDDLLDKYLYNYMTVAATLILYGIVFIIIERKHKNRTYRVEKAEDIDAKTALKIGCFQLLSLIPGTSRSGSTIIGAMLVNVSRTSAAEFSFFLAIPVMLGASALKILKYVLDYGLHFTQTEVITMIVGTLTAFIVSMIAIRFLVGFVRRHSFQVFGWYRIILGTVVLLYYFLTA